MAASEAATAHGERKTRLQQSDVEHEQNNQTFYMGPPPPQTPPPAYREQASRRSSKLAWTAGEGGAWPLPDGLWTTGAAAQDVDGQKSSTAPCSEKDPSKLGPAVEIVSTPMRSLKYFQEDKTAAAPSKRCQKILIVLVVLMAVVIVALGVGLGVGLHNLRRRHMKDDDESSSMCAQRLCSGNGMCEEINWQNVRIAWCTCYAGYTGLECEQSIGSCVDSCKHGTCMALPTGSSSSAPPPAAMPMGGVPPAQNAPLQPTSGNTPRPGPSGDPKPSPADQPPADQPQPSYWNMPTTNQPQYFCLCDPGYEGQNCDVLTKTRSPCDGVTCSYQGRCVSNSAKPSPSLPPTGDNPMYPNPMSPSNPDTINPYDTSNNFPNSPNPMPPSDFNFMNPNPSPSPPPGYGNSPPAPYGPQPTADPRAANDNYQCICDDGFDGKNCEIASPDAPKTSNACSSSPCLNGGLCVDLFDESSFLCICARGYRGDTCQCTASEWNRRDGHSGGHQHKNPNW